MTAKIRRNKNDWRLGFIHLKKEKGKKKEVKEEKFLLEFSPNGFKFKYEAKIQDFTFDIFNDSLCSM